MSIQTRVIEQFHRPHGPLGHVAGWIMAQRPSNVRRNHWTVTLLDLPPTGRVLEVGCGPGVALRRLLDLGAGLEVVGLDHSSTMIAQARRRNADAIETGRLRLVTGEMNDLDDSDVFDRIFSCNVVQFLDDRPDFFAKTRGHLGPGGRLVSTYQPRMRGARREHAERMAARLREEMERAGFVEVHEEWLDLQPVPVVSVVGIRDSQSG